MEKDLNGTKWKVSVFPPTLRLAVTGVSVCLPFIHSFICSLGCSSILKAPTLCRALCWALGIRETRHPPRLHGAADSRAGPIENGQFAYWKSPATQLIYPTLTAIVRGYIEKGSTRITFFFFFLQSFQSCTGVAWLVRYREHRQ